MSESQSRRFRFGKRAIENLRYPEELKGRQAEFSDETTPGLRLFLTRAGKRTFHYRYTIFSRKRCILIGPHPGVTVDEARERCWELKAMVARGEDPLAEKEKQKAALTFGEYSELYMAHCKKVNKSWKNFERMVSNIVAIWGDYPLKSISQRDVQKYLDSFIERKRAGGTHNRARSLLHRMFKVAIDHEYVTSNPVSGTRKLPENPEERHWISVEDSKKLLVALDEIPEQWRVSALAVKFLLLTGKRLGESLRIRWSDIEGNVVFLRQEMTKGKRADRIYLSDLAMEVVEELKKYRKENNPYLFIGLKPGTRLTTPKKVFASAKKLAGIDPQITLHGLRHGYASNLLDMGASIVEVKTLLNHKSITTTQKYLHAKDERLMARTQELSKKYQQPVSCLIEGDQ